MLRNIKQDDYPLRLIYNDGLAILTIQSVGYNYMFHKIWQKIAQPAAHTVDYDAIEEALLLAHVNYQAASAIIDSLRGHPSPQQALRGYLLTLLTPLERQIVWQPATTALVIGVNGSGKTTSIAKLAHSLNTQGKRLLLAAGDTYRAAAIEQLQRFGESTNTPVIAQKIGADSAAVIYDAMSSARAKRVDVLLADTAGRLHNNQDLMRELSRIFRVIKKFDSAAPQEVLLVCDATSGSNLLQQVEQFNAIASITALIYTKTDIIAKCGAILSVAHTHPIPIAYIGTGERLVDLQPFNARAFVDRLCANA